MPPLTLPPSAKEPTYALPQALLGDAAVAAFLLAAEAIREDQADVFSVEASVMVANVRTGVDAVLPRLAEVLAVRPRTDVAAILSLPNLARAVEHAAANCVAAPAVARAQLDSRYEQLLRYREPALLVAQALTSPLLAQDGVPLLPPEIVASIVSGSGMYDHAQDGVRLASLFRQHAPRVAGKHPFSDAWIDAMEEHGAWIMDNVTPTGARVRKNAPPEMTRTRDRLWTLLKLRHGELRKAAIELFGEDGADAAVPRLGTRAKATTATEAKPADPQPADPAKPA